MAEKNQVNPKLGKIEFAGDFSFVNKTSENIDDKDHRATVSWHLAHRYAQFKKQETLKSLAAESNRNSPNNGQIPRRLPFSRGTTEPYEFQSYNATPSNLAEEWIDDLSLPEWSIRDYLKENNRSDSAVPGSFSLKINKGQTPKSLDFVSGLISLAREILIPTLWPQLSSRQTWGYEISCSRQDLDNIRDDSFHSDASFAFLANICQAFVENEKMLLYADYYRRKAFLRLGNGAFEPTELDVFGVLKLFPVATVLDSTKSARGYLRILYSMCQARGGLVCIQPWLCQNIVAADCYFALKNGTRPIFQRSEWAPKLMIMPWMRKDLADATRQKRTQSISSAVEHIALRVLMVDLQELFDLEQFLSENHTSSEAMLRWS